jgi:tRNA (guanine10-N2)-dimethyltransferase
MHILALSQDNLELAKYEAASLLNIVKYRMIDNLMICNIDGDRTKKIIRLAYTRKAYRMLFISPLKGLKDALYTYDYSKIYKDDFCLRIHYLDRKYDLNESEYGGSIWRSLADMRIKPKVSLTNPKTQFEIFITENNGVVCALEWSNNNDFESRKAHLKPIIIPTAMMPKMARALVNIIDADEITDPFCGGGGILVEAGLMGLKINGHDIDKRMLSIAEQNLKQQKINPKKYSLKVQDATKIKNLKNIVTDLPYGKSSKKTDVIINMYSKFIKNITGKAIIVFPDFVDYKKILKNSLNKKLHVKKIITHYVHKSLTREIVIIDKE